LIFFYTLDDLKLSEINVKMRTTLSLISFLVFNLVIVAQEYVDPALHQDLKYRLIGPTRGGRVTTVAGVESQPNIFYMGATGGGVWKTTDYGQSWSNISDGYFTTGSIGAIRVYQKNPDIIYVGTGSDGIRSNIIAGKGVYKSSDAGKTWKFSGLRNAGQIGAVEINPDNPDIAYVAAIGNAFGPNEERGLFRTTDGGKTWIKILYISPNTGVCDVELCPDNPMIIYASGWTVERRPWTIISGSEVDGIFRSENGGMSWIKLDGGLPQGIVGKSDLAVCPAKPELLYVLVESKENPGLYISNDRGTTFKFVSNSAGLLDRPFYYTNIDVDPKNPDKIYVNSTSFHVSTDGGKSWSRKSTPHGDNHDMWINPSNTDVFIQSNDGGANITKDGGITWSTQNNQPTAELYQVDLDDQYPYWVYAGQQDNSTVAIPSLPVPASQGAPGSYYISVGGCETGPAVPKPGNSDIVYANCKGKFGRYSKITGQEKQYNVGAESIYGFNPKDLKYRFQRVSPIIVSPHDPNVIYHGSQFLHMTKDEGVTWQTISPDLTANEPDKQVISGSPITRDVTGEEYYSTIYAISESPVSKGVIWVGSNDGPVNVTKDGGKTWKNVTPPDLDPGGRVQTIEASPHNPAKAYFAVYRYLLNDWKPYIYKTDNYGETWKRLTPGSNGIPSDFPTHVVREDPSREGLLYAGTEYGMFISFDDGEHWQTFQKNLPVVPVTDIKVYRKDLVISTMGRSFWIMDNLTPLHQLGKSPVNEFILFKPREAFKIRRGAGADIDYWLPSDAKSIKISFFDKDGNNIINLRNTTGSTGDSLTLENWKSIAVNRNTSIPTSKGMHRYSWDMTTFGSVSTASRGRSQGGPQVFPGTYKIVFDVDGKTAETTIDIVPDPKITDDGVSINDLKEQYDLIIKVRDLLTEARFFEREMSVRLKPFFEKEAGKKKLSGSEKKEYEKLSDLNNKLVTGNDIYPQPMLIDQISYLYSMVNSVDQKPGKDAYLRLDELTLLLSEYKAVYKNIVKI
jgi:photosystem II stability/assembly factor-like uncharacterized protein